MTRPMRRAWAIEYSSSSVNSRRSPARLYEWLDRAYERKLVKRFGSGRNQDPWKFRLENADDKYLDRGQVPPPDEFDFRNMFGR